MTESTGSNEDELRARIAQLEAEKHQGQDGKGIAADLTKPATAISSEVVAFLRAVRPVVEESSGLAVDVVHFLRGPFRLFRAENLRKVADWVIRLREEQMVTEPKAIPPKTMQVLLEQASFEENDQIQKLWAQLIVNAQVGMDLGAYVFELLGKISASDAQLLMKASESNEIDEDLGTERLLALGLLDMKAHIDWSETESVDTGETVSDQSDVYPKLVEVPTAAEIWWDGYYLTPMGALLIEAATKPLAQIVAEREAQTKQREARKKAAEEKSDSP